VCNQNADGIEAPAGRYVRTVAHPSAMVDQSAAVQLIELLLSVFAWAGALRCFTAMKLKYLL
jgi:hypothetical protein